MSRHLFKRRGKLGLVAEETKTPRRAIKESPKAPKAKKEAKVVPITTNTEATTQSTQENPPQE